MGERTGDRRGIADAFVAALMVSTILSSATRAADPASAPAPQRAAYYVIPLSGAIEDRAGDAFAKSLAAARRANATHVLISMDTTGGDSSAIKAMVDALLDEDTLTPVAVVRQANVQTALVALACAEILVVPGATIGGIEQAEGKKLPAARRAEVEALARTIAQRRGHDDLLARGLVDPDLVLASVPDHAGDAGASRVVEIGNKNDATRARRAEGRRLKSAGELLVLTGDEALDLGLASGTVLELPTGQANDAAATDAVAAALGIDHWRRAGAAVGAMAGVSESEARRTYLRENDDELKKLGKKIRELETEERHLATSLSMSDEAKAQVNGAKQRRELNARIGKAQTKLVKVRDDLRVLRDRQKQIMKDAPKS